MDERRDAGRVLESIELRDLRYFLAVAEELNFTRAAERLHLAQQALSSAIRRLEAEVGVALFSRSTRHVALTSAGEALVQGAREVMAAAEDAVARVLQVAAGQRGRLVIGFSTAAGTVPVVRDIIRRFSEEVPDVDLRLVERDFGDPSAGLADGSVDVAFIFGPLPVAGLRSLEVLAETRLVALRPDHPLAAEPSVTSDQLAELPWMRVPAPPGPWVDFWFTPLCSGGPVGPEIRTADEWVPAVEAGRGVAFTMPTVMEGFPNTRIATVPVTDLPPATLVLAWRADESDPTAQAFVDRARRIVSESRGPAEAPADAGSLGRGRRDGAREDLHGDHRRDP